MATGKGGFGMILASLGLFCPLSFSLRTPGARLNLRRGKFPVNCYKTRAGMAESADAADLKSAAFKRGVGVRVPLSAPKHLFSCIYSYYCL